MVVEFSFVVFFLLTVAFRSEAAVGRQLGKFIKHYEPLYYDIDSLHSVHRRAVESRSDANFAFSAFGKFHRLNLRPDREIFTGDAKILSGDGKPFPFDRDAIVRGYVEGAPNSDVYGVIDKKDGFHGKILSGTENYYVDPSSWYFDEKQDFPSVIYKDTDLEYNHAYADIKQRIPADMHPQRVRRSSKNEGSRVRRQTEEELEKNACTLGLYADNFFTELFGGKTNAILQLVKQVQAAQIIYMNEFNTSGYYFPKGITFRVSTVVVFNKTDPLPSGLPAQVKDSNVGVDTLLDYFSRMNHDTVCEAFLFTNRDFDGGILGLAWIGSSDEGQAGGICDKFSDYGGGKKRSYNTGIVTMTLYGRFTPPRISEITFAHELGHGFGSTHDPSSNLECVPGGLEGNYIMFDKATSGVRANNDRFSKCSKDEIKTNVDFKRQKYSDCFKRGDEPICGNKIVEENEQCDCGDENTCTEKCCIPAGKERACKLVLQSGILCSPSQGPCCTEQCRYAGRDRICSKSTDCTKNQTCSGLSFSCNTPEPVRNETFCDQGRRVCYAGQCSVSVCAKYNMESCSCTVNSELCDLCCKQDGVCTPSSRLALLPPELKGLKLVPGTPCDKMNGYCDVFAVCRQVDAHGPLSRLKEKIFTGEGLKEIVKEYWWAILLGTIAFAVIIALMVFLCARYTPSSNPHKEAKKPAKTLPGRKRRPPPQQPYYQQGMEMPQRA